MQLTFLYFCLLLYKYHGMREKKMNIKDLEDAIYDGLTIDDMLGIEADVLRVDELHGVYERGENIRLNNDFRVYQRIKEDEFRQKNK